MKRTHEPGDQEVYTFLRPRRVLDLGLFQVLDGYFKDDEAERQRLKDASSLVQCALIPPAGLGGFLWYGGSGTGKTSLAQATHHLLKQSAAYVEVNIARAPQRDVERAIPKRPTQPTLFVLDEIDALLPDHRWPLDILFQVLSRRHASLPFVVIGAGSGGSTLNEFKSRLQLHPRGQDILNRIPSAHVFTFTPLTLIDAILVFASSARSAAREAGKELFEIEKLVLAYVALRIDRNAHDLARRAIDAVSKIPRTENRLKYSCLFDFWKPYDDHFKRSWPSLQGRFVVIDPRVNR